MAAAPFTDHKCIVLSQKKENLPAAPLQKKAKPILKIKVSLHILDTAACIVVVLQSQDPLMQNNLFC